MAIFNWHDNYSVKHTVIDNHHKKIIELFNSLYDNFNEQNYDIYGTVLDELLAYVDYHFTTEEQYMADINYEGAKNHIHEHRKFTEKLIELKNSGSDGKNENCQELIYYLGFWVLNHETEKDIELIELLVPNK